MVLFELRLSIRLPEGSESEKGGMLLDFDPVPVGLAVVELPEWVRGAVPVVRGWVEFAVGTEPLVNGAVPVDRGAVPLENGAVPLENGAVPLENGAVPLERGAVPVDAAAELLPSDDTGEPEAKVDENEDGGAREVPFVEVTAAEPDLGGPEIETDGIEVALDEIDIEPDAGAEENEGDGIDDVPLAVTDTDPDLGEAVMEAVGMEVPLVDTGSDPEVGSEEGDADVTEAVPFEEADAEPVLGGDEMGILGMDVPLAVAALPDSGAVPVLELGMLAVLLLFGGLIGFRSKALIVISLWNGVKLDCLVLKKQFGPTVFGKYEAA